MNTTFGVVEAPKDLVLRREETIEWIITYCPKEREHENMTFLKHADTWEIAKKGWLRDNPHTRIKKIEYYGTYQY